MDLVGLVFLALGAVSGSFAGVVAERVNTGQSWAHGRSRCNACSRELTGLDMVPVVSWLFSMGACRTCGARITARYALVEATLAALFWGAYHVIGISWPLLPFLLALIVLTALVIYDLRHMMVPTVFSTLFITASFIYAVLAYDSHTLGLALMLAGGIGFALFLFFALSGGRVMGLGDAPVSFGLALLAGTHALSGLVFSFWVGAVVGILLLWLHRGAPRMTTEVPFVPFLAAGFLLAFFTQWNPFSLIL